MARTLSLSTGRPCQLSVLQYRQIQIDIRPQNRGFGSSSRPSTTTSRLRFCAPIGYCIAYCMRVALVCRTIRTVCNAIANRLQFVSRRAVINLVSRPRPHVCLKSMLSRLDLCVLEHRVNQSSRASRLPKPVCERNYIACHAYYVCVRRTRASILNE